MLTNAEATLRSTWRSVTVSVTNIGGYHRTHSTLTHLMCSGIGLCFLVLGVTNKVGSLVVLFWFSMLETLIRSYRYCKYANV